MSDRIRVHLTAGVEPALADLIDRCADVAVVPEHAAECHVVVRVSDVGPLLKPTTRGYADRPMIVLMSRSPLRDACRLGARYPLVEVLSARSGDAALDALIDRARQRRAERLLFRYADLLPALSPTGGEAELREAVGAVRDAVERDLRLAVEGRLRDLATASELPRPNLLDALRPLQVGLQRLLDDATLTSLGAGTHDA